MIILGPEYEYVRSIWFFGVMCGISFAYIITVFVNIDNKCHDCRKDRH